MERWWQSRRDSIAIALVISFLFHSLLVLGAVYFAARRESALSIFERLASRAMEVEIEPRPGPSPVELPTSEPRRPSPTPLAALDPERRETPVPRRPEPLPAPEPKAVPKPEPKPEPKPKPEVKVELVPVQPSRLKMVEVNNPETDKPPENARFLSDKNRQVTEETRAVHTNLEKDHPKPAPSSDPGGKEGKTPGGEQERIAETREQKSRPGASERAPRTGSSERPSPLLAMRRIGAPGAPSNEKPSATSADGFRLAPAASAAGQGGEGGRAQRSRAGLDLNLSHRSLDRIDGKAAGQARELARLSPSVHKGKFDKKWQAVRAALENFVPEVKPGNQTALGTRADPFAVYIARMHRKIHKLWGFGFLSDLDLKPDSHPMNKMEMWTMIEVVIHPGGEVDKATIVRPSGYLPYDVAALDTVLSSGPYEAPPRAIRSADGKVYLHWRFHRDQRQCGTFGVDPFILTTPPRGPVDNPYGEVKGDPGSERQLRRLHRAPSKARAPRVVDPPAPAARPSGEGKPSGEGRPAPGKGAKNPGPGAAEQARVDPADPAARAVVQRFLSAFSSRDPRAMAAACGFPFHAHGRKAASSAAELERQLGDLLREAGGNGGPQRIHSAGGGGGQGRPREGGALLRLLTVGQARVAYGRQPAGAEHGSPQLVGELRLGKLQPLVILERRAGKWLLVGINR